MSSRPNSQFNELIADNVHIEGSLDIRGVRSLSAPDATDEGHDLSNICRVSLRGARIGDGIEAAHARLVAPVKDIHYQAYSRRSEYALDMPEAKVKGDIRLFPDFVALGGVNMNGAFVEGSVHAHGAYFTTGQTSALDASGAEIHGDLTLDTRNVALEEWRAGKNTGVKVKRFVCDGPLRLHNITVWGDLRLNGADIKGADGGISAEHITVKGDLGLCAYTSPKALGRYDEAGAADFEPCLIPFECQERVDLRGATVSGDLDVRGAKLGNTFDASAGVIGGHALFGPSVFYQKEKDLAKKRSRLSERFEAKGDVKLDGMKVKGDLVFRGAHIEDELKARGMDVQGLVDFSAYEVRDAEATIWPFVVCNDFKISSATFSRSFDLRGACIEGEVEGQNLRVGGKLLMCGFVPKREFIAMRWFDARERINLSGAVISGDFDLTGAKLEKGLRFRNGRVEGALIFDVVDGKRFDGDWKNRNSIDLFNAHANNMSDRSNRDYEKLGYGNSYFLRLEGFTYTRFSNYRVDDESLGQEERDRRHDLAKGLVYRSILDDQQKRTGADPSAEDSIRAARIANEWQSSPRAPLPWKVRCDDWLNRQYRKRKPTRVNYNPDPYNTLYKFYKRMGAQSTADRILMRKLTVERTLPLDSLASLESVLQALVYLGAFFTFDRVFGWGLAPLRATAFYLLFIVIVASGIASSQYDIGLSSVPSGPSRELSSEQGGMAFAAPGLVGSRDGQWLCPAIKPSQQSLISNTVKAVGYALQLAIPSLEFLDKDQCRLEAPGQWRWDVFRLLATVIGWVMTSVTLLTWTGLFRRNIEP